jgi:hypothetical protein
VTKRCETCGSDFTVAYRFREQKTCGRKCMGPLISAALKTSVELKCTCCGSTYEATKSYAGKSKYCSYQCFLRHKWKRDSSIVELTCKGCGGSFAKKFTQRKTRFCSRSCATSGERNGACQTVSCIV